MAEDFYPINHEVTLKDIKKFNYPNQKIGVLAYIENAKGEILLQQRGIKSRDENGLFETIGGKVEADDFTFKDAIIREVKEEAGDDVKLNFNGNSIGIFHCFKNNINWIFVIYFVKYFSGDFKVMEPDKCMGYNFFSYEEATNSDLVTENCKYLIKSIKNSHK